MPGISFSKGQFALARAKNATYVFPMFLSPWLITMPNFAVGQVVTLSGVSFTGYPMPTAAYGITVGGVAQTWPYTLATGDANATVVVTITLTSLGNSVQYVLTAVVPTQGIPPLDVTTPTFLVTDGGSLVLSWNPPASGTPPANYLVSYRVTGSPTYSTPVSTTALYTTVGNLVPATSYDVLVQASTADGASPGVTSTTTTASTFALNVVGNPLEGKPATYTASPSIGTVITQQWYKNTGSGPVAIAGATSATYVVQHADIGSYLSVRATTANGVFASFEFPSTNHLFVLYPARVSASGSTVAQYIGTQGSGVTVKHPTKLRIVANNSTTHLQESIVGPGFYSNATLGDLSAFGATVYTTSVYDAGSYGPPPVLAQVASSAPATATRPTGNTGSGYFVANGEVYDPNGHKFRIRGINHLHWDSNPQGIWNAGANLHRIWIDFSQPWATNKALLDLAITNKVVPMVCLAYARAYYSATFADNGDGTGTMTVTSWTHGNVWVGMTIPAGGGVPACTVTADSASSGGSYTGTGKTGTYKVSVASTVTTPVAYTIALRTTDSPMSNQPAALGSVVKTLIDNWSNLAPYDTQMILNVTNEWGPAASSSNTVWRDTYIAQIPLLRAAGFTCPISVDMGAAGQDSYAALNHMVAVLTQGDQGYSGSQSNLIGAIHVYGSSGYGPGKTAPVLANLPVLAAANQGLCYLIEEFGTWYKGDSITADHCLSTIAVAESLQVGWVAWAWDDNDLTGGTSDDASKYAMVYNNSQGLISSTSYPTGNIADLTTYGQCIVTDPVFGLRALAQKSTVFN